MENPTANHLLAAKRILRYLQRTRDFGLFYKKGARSNLIGFTNNDFASETVILQVIKMIGIVLLVMFLC